MKRTLLLSALAMLLLPAGCELAGEDSTGDPKAFSLQGTVEHLDIESGHWVILGNDSTRYVPQALPASFRKEGLSIQAQAVLQRHEASACQCGSLIELRSIEKQ